MRLSCSFWEKKAEARVRRSLTLPVCQERELGNAALDGHRGEVGKLASLGLV
jgi:hypothetical protein